MRKSILDNCGRYSGKLIKISNMIFEQKIKNGEPIIESDRDKMEDEIFQAYQSILSIAKDGNTISMAIQNLTKAIENTGRTDLANLAVSSVALANEQVDIKEENSKTEVFSEINKDIETTIFAKEKEINIEFLDRIFDNKGLQDLGNTINKAKEGDIQANADIKNIQAVSRFMARTDTLDEKSERGALAWMRILASSNSPMAQKYLKMMAEKYDFDIFDFDEKGIKTVNSQKINALYREKIGKVNVKASEKSDEFFENINIRRGKRAIEEGENSRYGTPDDLVKDIKKGSQESVILKRTKEALKRSDLKRGISEQTLKNIAENFPEVVLQILTQKIDACQKLQEREGNAATISRLQQEILLLGDVVSSREVKKQEGKIEQVQATDSTRNNRGNGLKDYDTR